MPPPFPDPAPHVPRVVPIRLLPTPVPLLFSFILGLVLTAIGGALWWAAHHYLPAEQSFGLLNTLCGIFVFVGLLFLWSCLYQVRRKLVPPTVAEISSQMLDRSRPIQFALIQPGPVRWSLLQARLICTDRRTSIAERSDGEAYQKVKEKKLHDLVLLEARKVRVAKGEIWHEQREVTLPLGARVSSITRDYDSNTQGIVWSIEVRGKGPFVGGFLHRYKVQVV